MMYQTIDSRRIITSHHITSHHTMKFIKSNSNNKITLKKIIVNVQVIVEADVDTAGKEIITSYILVNFKNIFYSF